MGPLAVELSLLRAVAPELRLRVGMTLPARVLERAGTHGVLDLAGAIVSARLPDELQAGARLRLRVTEVSREHAVLQVADPPPAAPAAPVAAPAVPLPGGGSVRVAERSASGGGAGGARHVVALVYESATAGPMDLRLELDAAGVRAGVAVREGQPLERARDGAHGLREALARATGRPARVTVGPRRERVDVRA